MHRRIYENTKITKKRFEEAIEKKIDKIKKEKLKKEARNSHSWAVVVQEEIGGNKTIRITDFRENPQGTTISIPDLPDETWDEIIAIVKNRRTLKNDI